MDLFSRLSNPKFLFLAALRVQSKQDAVKSGEYLVLLVVSVALSLLELRLHVFCVQVILISLWCWISFQVGDELIIRYSTT